MISEYDLCQPDKVVVTFTRIKETCVTIPVYQAGISPQSVFPRGKNGPAHSFPGKKLTGEKNDRYTGTLIWPLTQGSLVR